MKIALINLINWNLSNTEGYIILLNQFNSLNYYIQRLIIIYIFIYINVYIIVLLLVIMKTEVKNLKELVSILQEYISTFSNPKEHLEQYQTEPQIAGEIAHYIYQNYDISNMKIADLGCGTGILGISLALYGCNDITLFDIDDDAIDIAYENIESLGIENKIQIVKIDVRQMKDIISIKKKFDLVITNPPFGIRSNKGYDLDFLKSAINICNGDVFSLHKLSTIKHLKMFYNKYGIKDINTFKINYDLPESYKFHKKKNKVIEVVCIQAKVSNNIYQEEK